MRRRFDPILLAILAAFIALAVWYSVTIPLGEAPDELPHFTYVRYLAQHARIPATTEEHEAFQPPLYYALGAVLTFWLPDGSPFAMPANADFNYYDPLGPKNLLLHTAAESWPYRGWALAWHLVRLLSIALGAMTVWAVYGLGRVVFAGMDRGRAVALAMAALVAFTPQFLFMSAVVNNDNAATAFSALVLWQTAALLRDGLAPGSSAFDPRLSRRLLARSGLLGLLLGLGLLSKANLIALVPVVGLAILVAYRPYELPKPDKPDRSSETCQVFRLRSAVLSAILVFGLAALLSGWYFYRNWALHGDPLGWSFLLQVNARREEPLTLGLLLWLLRGLFRTFWLGWMSISFENTVYWAIAAACVVGLAGFVGWLVRRAKGGRAFDAARRWILLLLALYAALMAASLLKWTVTVQGTDQGRLIYPLLPAIMLVLAGGWAWWARRRAAPLVLGAGVAGLLALAVITPVRYIAPLYRPAVVATEADLAAATSADVNWGPLRLLGYRLENDEAKPGGRLVLHLYWQAQKTVNRNLLVLVQLEDANGKFLMYTDGSPSAGRDTTDRWTPGVPLASRHVLPIPDYGQPGAYRLTLSVHPSGQQTWLHAESAAGSPIGDRWLLPETIHLVP